MGFMEIEVSDEAFCRILSREGDYWIPAFAVSDESVEETIEGKWFARYSAPGYLDATDWMGPYDSAEEAEAECRSVYGDEEDSESED